jgi:hypothetical protein
MSRTLDYEADPQLSELLERLRVALEHHPSPPPEVLEGVEDVMRQLMARNKRRRMLQRMRALGLMDGRPEQMRQDVEAADAQLRESLPSLLARLEAPDSPQGP